MRVTASLREETPSFRYRDVASDFTVCREMWSRSPISAMERCVGSMGTSLRSAPANEGAEVVAHPPVISSEGHAPDGFANLHGKRVEVHADGLSRVVLSSNFIQTG